MNRKKLSNETKTKIIRSVIVLVLLVLIFLAIYLPLYFTGLTSKLTSLDEIKAFILRGGAYSYFIFVAIQFLQCTILPIPGFFTTAAGAIIFGPWVAFLLSSVTLVLGSIFSFWLGKKFGHKLVVWMLGEASAKKWNEKLAKGKYIFFLMMLLPLFPDDILCIVVGASEMSYKFFITTILLSRPIGVFVNCFLGSGELIPYTGWGIPVWILFGVIVVIIFVLSYLYQEKIESFITRISQKVEKVFKKKNKNEKLDENTETSEGGGVYVSAANKESKASKEGAAKNQSKASKEIAEDKKPHTRKKH